MKKTLEELQAADLPKATASTVGLKLSGKDEEIGRRIFDKYFSMFVCPKSASPEKGSWAGGRQECVQCGSRLDGIIGTFQWGMQHGEGSCAECGYLCRALHRINDEEGKPFAELGFTILQYHPEELVRGEGGG